MTEISACGAVKDEWLAGWGIKPEDRESAWQAKLNMDERIANNSGRIVANVGIINEIQPYRSQIDGSMIDSRTKHRNHLKNNGCIEIGNEVQKQRTPEAPKGLRDAIGKAVYQHLK